MNPAQKFKDIYRVQNSLKTLERYNDPDLNRYIKPLLEHRLGKEQELHESRKTLIAFSGGIDSKATLLIAKEFSLNPEAVTFLIEG
jgi:predicted PP-loop superfamily ATPase